MIDDCPPDISFEECLKRQLASNHHSHSPSMPIQPMMNISTSKPVVMKHKHSSFIGSGSNYFSSASSYSPSHHSSGSGFGFSMNFGKSGGSYISKSASYSRNSTSTSKGGIVVNKQSVIVKSNFEMAGRLNKSGKRNSAKTLGSHASASLNYMENHGARDLEQNDELSNIYDENGERLSKEEFNELKKELNEGIGAFRRTVIDVGHNELDRDDLNRLVRESLQDFQEQSGKQFNYAYAIHTDTDNIHAHILSYGESHQINMTKEHLQLFKQTVGEKTNELLQEHKLENDRDLSLLQRFDKSIDGILDNKDDFHHSKNQSLSL
jgi:hypothetical protein